MLNVKMITMEAVDVKKIAAAIVFSLIMLFVPQLVSNQLIAGSIVNATLILSLLFFGYRAAFILCFVPSMVALLGGLLPLVMAPVLPFIMIANVIYISIIFYLKKSSQAEEKSYFIALLLASITKFAFLALSVRFLAGFFLEGTFVQKLLIMFSWPQLMTALMGGIIAYSVYKVLNLKENKLV